MINKLTKKEFWKEFWKEYWDAVSDIVLSVLLGNNYRKLKFTVRLQKAFLQSKENAAFISSSVIVIYGLVYIGRAYWVGEILGLLLGFYILFKIFFEVFEVIFIEDEAYKNDA